MSSEHRGGRNQGSHGPRPQEGPGRGNGAHGEAAGFPGTWANPTLTGSFGRASLGKVDLLSLTHGVVNSLQRYGLNAENVIKGINEEENQ